MELCEGGDMEEYIRKLSMQSFEAAELPALIFQMLFSLYSSRDILGMRPYDLKLLNFLLARPETTDPSVGKPPGYLYHFAYQQFGIPVRGRTAERRVGIESVSRVRYGWSEEHSRK